MATGRSVVFDGIRKTGRDRKPTDKYVAGASCDAVDTRHNFDRNRRQSQSPNRQRMGETVETIEETTEIEGIVQTGAIEVQIDRDSIDKP